MVVRCDTFELSSRGIGATVLQCVNVVDVKSARKNVLLVITS